MDRWVDLFKQIHARMPNALIMLRGSDVEKRFTEVQIVGFLREADTGMPVKQLCQARLQ